MGTLARRCRQRRAARRARRLRLFIEPLEDRLMLATITVTKLADDTTVDAQVTLREAILAANTDTSVDGSSAGDGADTISFAQNLFGSPRTITLALGELPITEALTITGPGQDVLTIDAQQQSRILNVFPGIATGDFDVTVDGLTLTGGRTTGSNQIINGILESTHSGGAIRFDSLGTLALINSTISKSSTAGDFALGGGIRSLGALELTNSTISGNSTKGSNATGGGVHTVGPLSITNSTISANSTAGNFAGGGGVLALDSVALTNSAVTGNGTGGNSSVGGGIFSIGGAFTLINSTISENRTAGNGAFGGGVATTVPLVSTNSTISGNSTTGESSDGGGVSANSSVTLINSTVSGNKTEGDFADGGGVVMFDNAALRISNSIIAGNTVAFGNVGPDFLPEQTPIIPALTLSVTNSLIGDNSGTSLNAAPVGSPDTDGNLIGTSVSPINPLLGPLGNNGGPTQTHALLPGSPAIDAGNSTIARDAGLDYDQRGIGFERTVDGDNDGMMIVDMGAFEFSVDFGDAPAPYLTTFAEDGARHVAIGPTLGTTRDTEAGGTHSANADHDDTNGDSDEDGVTFGTIRVGQLDATATVNVQGGSARLDAWIDFNQDGSWGGAWEQIADNVLVQTGDNTIEFDVPSWAVSGTTYARFRVSTVGNLAVGGEAEDGEIEDYAINISPPTSSSAMFLPEKTITTGADGAEAVFAADMDGDGDLDVLSASQSDKMIAWYENDGAQDFSRHIITTDLVSASFVVADDFDGDGDMDVVAAGTTSFFSSFPFTIVWYENDGQQNFTAHQIGQEDDIDGIGAVHPADIDGDGDTDVLFSQRIFGKVGWYENDGQQNFSLQTIDATGNAISLKTADIDGDGDTDFVAVSEQKNAIVWYENTLSNGNGFSKHILSTSFISTGIRSPMNAFPSDVDSDGDLDVLAILRFEDKVAWFENTSPPKAKHGGPYTFQEGTSAGLNANGSSDIPDSNAILAFEWDLDYDGVTFDVDVTGEQPRVSFPDDFAARNIALRVTDTRGESDLDTTTLVVTNVSPAISLVGDSSVNENAPYELTLGEISDPGQDTVTQWIVDWGDGSGKQTFTSDGVKTHVYVEGDITPTITVDLVDEDGTHGNVGALNITVVAFNRPPVANHQEVTTDEDRVTALTLTGSDPEDDSLSYAVLNGPEYGQLTGDVPNLTYSPASNYHGDDQFTFRVNDGELDSEVATVDISVTAVNDAPVAEPQSLTTNEDTALDVLLVGSDVESDSLTFSLMSLPQHGSLAGTIPNLRYTPEENYHGEDAIVFAVSDAQSTSPQTTVSITIEPVNDPPTVENLQNATGEDTPITIELPYSDLDGDELSIQIIASDIEGIAAIVVDGSSRMLSYDPSRSDVLQELDRGESVEETIMSSVSDGNGGIETATVVITVHGITDWQNPIEPLDANGDGEISPLDALVIVNSLNSAGARALLPALADPKFWYDVNGDGFVSPLDALLIINRLNGPPSEGETGVYGINGLVFEHPASSQLATHRIAPDRTAIPRALSAANANNGVEWSKREVVPRYHAGHLSRNSQHLKALDEFLATFDDEQASA